MKNFVFHVLCWYLILLLGYAAYMYRENEKLKDQLEIKELVIMQLSLKSFKK